jgi:3-hydroxybutyryl-CoA dehydrogenase
LAELAPATLVIEAVVEDLAVKRALFRELEDLVGPRAILATNTSSLAVTAIAAGLRDPSRVAGLHYFNPAPLMKVVEVVEAARTAPWVMAELTAFVRRTGHKPVLAKDSPGFIVNHAGRGFGTEALRVLGEGVADVAAIDAVLRDTCGFRMGPFELLDLTGLDVSHPVMESIYQQFYEEPRFRPSWLTRQRLAAGLLGRKTKAGFFRYDDAGRKIDDGSGGPLAGLAVDAGAPLPASVWVAPAEPELTAAVLPLLQRLGAKVETGPRPSATALCVLLPLGEDASTVAAREGLDATRCVAFDALPLVAAGASGPEKRRVIMGTPATTAAMLAQAARLFGERGVAVTVLRDSPGFIAQRVVATIVNIGCDIVQQRLASPEDLETAVMLGLGYPRGPLGLGDAFGARRIHTVLTHLAAVTGDPRYRPSLWLRRRAQLDLPLATHD